MDRARELRQEKERSTPPSPERPERNPVRTPSSSSKQQPDRSQPSRTPPSNTSSAIKRTPSTNTTPGYSEGTAPLVVRAAPPKPKDPSKVEPGGPGNAPRRREPKNKGKDSDIVERLKAICTDADPTKLYRNLVKIGQGLVGFGEFLDSILTSSFLAVLPAVSTLLIKLERI